MADQRTGVEIRLRPHFTEDHKEYEWLSVWQSGGEEVTSGCAACHSRPGAEAGNRLPVEQWLLDTHSRTVVNPIFLDLYRGTDSLGKRSPATRWGQHRDYGAFQLAPDPTQPYQGPGYKLDFPQTAGNCGCCHVPVAAVDRPYEVDPTVVTGTAREGVACDFCHKIWAVRLDAKTRLPQRDMPGVLSFEYRRPPKNRQFFAGPFDDVATGNDTYSPLMRRSEFCAPCHFAAFWGTVIYNSYGEWLASPYSDPRLSCARTCQDCHMPRGLSDHFAVPEKGGRRRDRTMVASHQMPGVSDERFMRNAVSMSVSGRRTDIGVVVVVRITNDRTGHHMPTDSPMRQALLTVRANADDGSVLPLTEGSVLPVWAGDLRGRPGRAFAKILRDIWSNNCPAVSYWNPTRIESDTRIAAFATDTSEYRFRATREQPVVVEVRLIYRRAFSDLAFSKKWKLADLEMAAGRVVLGAEPQTQNEQDGGDK